jgi:hypothetical protein
VSGNKRHGIKLLRTRQETLVFHNLVGVNAIGGGAIGNLGDGILIQNAFHIVVQENVVANNTLTGVVMMPRSGPDLGNVLAANSIYSNGLIGIDLTNTINVGGVNGKGDGKTDNTDDGPTNFPSLTAATTSAVGTIVAGTLNGTPNTSFRVELFDSPTCDNGGFGEGRGFIGGFDIGTNATGDVSFTYTVATIPNGHVVTATSSNPLQQTSEFSGCKDVTTAAILVTPTSGLITSELGQTDTFTVALSTLPTSNVTINLSVKKANGDPSTEATLSSPSLVFSSADGTTPKQVTVTGQPDAVADGNQVFKIVTAAASSSDVAYSGLDAADVFGVNHDAPTVPTVTVAAAQVTEGNGASVPMSFNLTLSPASTQTVVVSWQLVFGSATLPDFLVSDAAGSVSFAPGETTKAIVVNVAGDTLVEGTETFTMRLNSATNATIGVESVTGTILDNDSAGTPCSPRPNIVMSTSRTGTDQLIVTLKAGSGTIKKITFASASKPMTNATVETIGPAGVIANTGIFTPPAGVTQQSFIIRRTAPHKAVMVAFVVEDGCGQWNTFIGTGPEGF